MKEPNACRADLHCHSSASAHARLGVQDALGLPECATPPVVAVAAGGPAELVADGRSGVLCEPRAEALGGAVAREVA